MAWLPVSWLYYLIVQLRMMAVRTQRVNVPVVCVGNTTVGGAGKTPTAIAICQWLREQGHQPHFISRGYLGHYTGTLRVNPQLHIAQEVGDEPLLLARHAPCWVSRRRMHAAQAAIKAGASVIIMDDGLQNPTLHKDCSVLVIDAAKGIGNGLILPAGPCREPLSRSLRKVQMVLLMGADTEPRLMKKLHASGKPIFHAQLKPSSHPSLQGMRVHPFAGIGNPDKFFATVEQVGGIITLSSRFPDHHYYTQADLSRLQREAAAHQSTLITTEKDATRLPDDFLENVLVLPVALDSPQQAEMQALVMQHIGQP